MAKIAGLEDRGVLHTTAPLNLSGSGGRKASRRSSDRRKQDVESTLPEPLVAPAAIMVRACFPGPKALGELAPRGARPCDPHHRFDPQTPLLGVAAPLGLCGLKQRADALPKGIGEFRQSRQTDRRRDLVWRRDTRGLAGATLLVTPTGTGLMRAPKARPPHDFAALLLCHLEGTQQATHFRNAQLETNRLARLFFSRARWRTTASTA